MLSPPVAVRPQVARQRRAWAHPGLSSFSPHAALLPASAFRLPCGCPAGQYIGRRAGHLDAAALLSQRIRQRSSTGRSARADQTYSGLIVPRPRYTIWAVDYAVLPDAGSDLCLTRTRSVSPGAAAAVRLDRTHSSLPHPAPFLFCLPHTQRYAHVVLPSYIREHLSWRPISG